MLGFDAIHSELANGTDALAEVRRIGRRRLGTSIQHASLRPGCGCLVGNWQSDSVNSCAQLCAAYPALGATACDPDESLAPTDLEVR